MSRHLAIALLTLLCTGIYQPATAPPVHAAPTTDKLQFRALPKPGQRVLLDGNSYFVYGFTKAPKLGMCIMKVEIFRRDGSRDTSFSVKGDADMPSMRGAHATGDKEFSLSAKGMYLLPVNLVMPGDWEVRLSFAKNGQTILRGAYLFDL